MRFFQRQKLRPRANRKLWDFGLRDFGLRDFGLTPNDQLHDFELARRQQIKKTPSLSLFSTAPSLLGGWSFGLGKANEDYTRRSNWLASLREGLSITT
jgi:hypothetical protein